MEAFKYFMEEMDLIKNIEEIYFRIRLIFQREGWSDEDLQKPPYYPPDLMRLFHKFTDERNVIFKTVRDYGFDVNKVNLSNYIQSELKKIDDITPLKN